MSYKLWTKPTSYEVNHNTTNFYLKQKVFENQTNTKVQDCVLNNFNKGKNYYTPTLPWSITNDLINLKMMEKYIIIL